MNDTNTAPEGAGQVVVEKAVAAGKTKTKPAENPNLLLTIAQEIESLSKAKALKLAETLADDIDTNTYKLGGVLKKILEGSWFEGFDSFDAYVYEKFGFQSRKAKYLMQIYEDLSTKQIPWEKVAHLGWTKLKDLAPVLTLDNLDEWVAKAGPCTVMELQAMLKASTGTTTDAGTAKTTDEVVKLNFKVHKDQAEMVTSALSKAKAELQTDADTVALTGICAAYLGNTVSMVSSDDSFLAKAKTLGMQAALEMLVPLWPEVDISVVPAAATEEKG